MDFFIVTDSCRGVPTLVEGHPRIRPLRHHSVMSPVVHPEYLVDTGRYFLRAESPAWKFRKYGDHAVPPRMSWSHPGAGYALVPPPDLHWAGFDNRAG
jgi:hypothetical protein